MSMLRRTSEIISEVQKSGDLKSEQKGVNDPVTQADFRSQYILNTGLKSLWPDLRIIGEETEDKLIKSEFDFGALSSLPETKGLEDFEKEFNVEDLAVYIDPLDGTKSFVDGKLKDVTTLIGMSYKSKPLLGLITQLWPNNPENLDPIAFVGLNGVSKVSSFKLNDYTSFEKLEDFTSLPKKSFDSKDPWIIACSINHYHPEVEELLKLFIPYGGFEKVRASGMGNKYIKLLKGEIDGHINNLGGMGPWDTLAGTAITEALGAANSGIRGLEYVYDGSPTMRTLDHGFFFLNSKEVHSKLIEEIQEFYKKKEEGK